ncbi:MAG: carbohydrate ABC transporter permease [Bacillota bacterium]
MKTKVWKKFRKKFTIDNFKNIFHLDVKDKLNLYGYIFVTPFILGLLFFFIRPVVQSISLSLSELSITSSGFELDFIGLDNFEYAFFVDPDFVRTFVETLIVTLIDVPAILILSFFIAVLLNQKFRGRLLARIVFFLPVILSAEIISIVEDMDIITEARGLTDLSGLFTSEAMRRLLLQLQLPEGLLNYVINAVTRLPILINNAAIPILIFLAGLQSIPNTYYEVAKIDGGGAWENFWKITFPLMTPLFLTNTVYIIIDSFTGEQNELMSLIENTAWGRGIYGVSVAMSWTYFIVIAILLMIVARIVSGRVHYLK